MTVDELKALIEDWAFARSHTDDCSINWDQRRAAMAQGQEAIEPIDQMELKRANWSVSDQRVLRQPPKEQQETVRQLISSAPEADWRSFGFEYEYEGKRYAFHIVAESREEAEGRLAALIHAQFVGELHASEALA